MFFLNNFCPPNSKFCAIFLLRFIRDHTSNKELLGIVRKLYQSFKLNDETSVEEFFHRYSVLTPGYRALVKRNNPVALALMRKHAKRETEWISLLYPFSEEYFPKVVTRAIMDFLYHI